MAFIQTDFAKGYRQVAQPPAANSLHTVRVFLDLSVTGLVAAADKVELCPLPMHCRIRSATVVPAGIGAGVTADIGIMSGTPGDPDAARTVGDQIFDGVTINATAANSADADMYALAPVAYDRSIGMIVSADIAAGAGKSITVLIDYYQDVI